MYAHKKFSILSFVVFLSLVLSLVFPAAAMADDSTPPPPAAPASPAADNPPAQISNPDTSSNEAAPADAAPSNAAPTDAAPKDAAPMDTEATDVASSSTDAAATEVPASSTDAAATEVPSGSTDVAPTEPVATDMAVEPTADVVAALNNAGAVLMDENGNPLPLVSQQAADVLSVGDPIGCPAGSKPASFGGTGLGCTGSYTSIQSAINDGFVTSGWTIYIDAGSYHENVDINKSVTVLGKGQTQTFIYPNTNNPDIGCSGSCANSTNTVFLISADNVFVQDLTINGDSPILSGGQVVNGADINTHNGIVDNNNNGLTVENVTIKNVYARGIQYGKSGGTFTIQNNTIDNVAGGNYSIGIFNTGGSGTIKGNTVNNANDAISANHSQGTQFINNTVTNSGSGIHTDNYGDSGLVGTDLIDGNTISNGPANSYGIFVFAPYSPLTVSNNSITNVDYGLALSGNGWHDPINTITFNNNTVNSNIAGAYVTTDVWGYFTSDVTATFNNNIFTGGQYGLYLESQGSGDSLPVGYSNGCTGDCKLNVTAFDNSITNHTLANVFYATGQIPWYGSVPDYNGVYSVNASGNWWGTNDPAAVASQVPAGVDYTPWLNNGTDMSPASGFQGDFSTVDVGANSPQTGSTGRIQEGVNLVTAGGTVLVAPGTYAENIIISTPMTLRSISGPASTFIDSSITGNPYNVFISASDVTLDGFDISSPGYAGSSDASGVVVEPPYVPNAQIRITNNIIHDIGTPGRTSVSFGNVGINIGGAEGVEIDHNQIFNIIHSDPAAWANGISIWGTGPGTPSGNIIIHDNSFHDISSPYPADADISTQTDVGSVTVYNNSLISTLAHPTEFGVEVRDTNTVMAENNWWGDASGPYDNSAVPDACGLSLTNPTGAGNAVSPCVIYDPWLTKDPFAAAGSGGASGGNGRGKNATLIAGQVIPVTGGQPTTLSCDNPSVTMQIGDIQVTFTGLCGYDVVLDSVTKENLPGDLGSSNYFNDGLSITLLKNGKEIKTLPADASIQVSYPKPSSGSPSVLAWSGSTWIDQASFVDGNNIISDLAAPATLVLVTH